VIGIAGAVPAALVEAAGYETIDFGQVDVRSRLLERTGGGGPDKCIDAVGLEATHGSPHGYPATG
jgi:threonine dehydrogenase-like Zn-dependent dehydrogenase